MPTGYTAKIGDDISFNEFIMNCARAMGARIMMRDEPSGAEIPDKFEPSTYHIKAFKKATLELTRLQKLSSEEADEKAKTEFKEAVESHQKSMADNNKLREKYQTMLANVKRWIPPSPDHTNFKSFMIEQITSSIEHDCSNSYYLDNSPVLSPGKEWLSRKISGVLRNIDYHEKENQKEVERTTGRNLWIQQLRSSLDTKP